VIICLYDFIIKPWKERTELQDSGDVK